MHLQSHLLTQKDSPEHSKHSSLQEFLDQVLQSPTVPSGVLQTATSRVPTLRTPENKEEPNSLADPVVQSKNERFHRSTDSISQKHFEHCTYCIIPWVKRIMCPKLLCGTKIYCSVLQHAQIYLVFCCFYLLLLQRCAVCSFDLTWGTSMPQRAKIKLI